MGALQFFIVGLILGTSMGISLCMLVYVLTNHRKAKKERELRSNLYTERGF